MRRSKKKRINYGKVLLAIICVVILFVLGFKLLNKVTKEEKILMIDVTEMDVEAAKTVLEDYKLDIDISYQNSDEFEKNEIISQSIPKDTEIKAGDKLSLVVSLGKLDKEKLKNDGINELGKVPIMMYHGIKNMKNSETANTGGNVDKDGYTRTVEAFRNDLEFYYEKGYRMIKLSDYIAGKIDVPYGKSPIILTFDDGNDNNIKVTGLDDNGNIIIDKNSAVGVLEEFKKKYPDYNVTAIFFVTGALFNQPEYNEKILNWLVDNGYEVGNHTKGHNNLSNTSTSETQEVVGYVYDKLEGILGEKYAKIVALPFGSPYVKSHANYQYVINGEYNGKKYSSIGALRVGWEPEVSPFNKEFDPTFLKRCRAYDNNGKDFDIEMVFRMLDKTRYVSDGDINRIVTSKSNNDIIKELTDKEIVLYE